jgi:poly(3-hydroxybutyrate) depolymerase
MDNVRMNQFQWRLLAFVFFLLAVNPVQAAKIQILFDRWEGPPLKVFISRPSGLKSDRPVVFFMHGMQSNADEYRDQWHDLALEHDFLLVVPEFRQSDFSGPGVYDLEKMTGKDGKFTLPENSPLLAIEAVFGDIRRRFEMTTDVYSLYGHSAGAQIVNQFLFHVPDASLAQAVIANADWYVMPNFEIEFPYGLKNSAVKPVQLVSALQAPVTLLLGAQDNDPEHPDLRRTPETMAQGNHRLERGTAFFNAARRAARELGVPFAWHLVIAPGADHDDRLMVPAAVNIMLKRSELPDQP